MSAARVVVIGLGNRDRGDDGAGPAVAAGAARATGLPEDACPPAGPVDLLDRWEGADLAVVVDAVRSGARPGTVHVVDRPDAETVPGTPAGSTHGLGLACALRLSRAVGRAPGRVVLVGIEGRDFATGSRMSPEVAAALPEAVQTVVGLIEEARRCA